MTPNPRLAARYAKSILDLAVEKGQLEDIYKDMVYLRDLFRASQELVSVLQSPIIRTDKKKQILEVITKGRISALTAAFVSLVMAKEREASLPEIAAAFIGQYKEYKGIQTVKLTTAVPIGQEVRQVVLDKVKADRKAQHVELDAAVNAALIGGFVLEIGDELIDASVAYDLNKIRQQFESNDFIYKIR
ncbi:MAG TPA: ATP synthase F1 subunit delta [Puia sp.]|nr:ATP synthase F1 subunit delta [Puia sp.]